MQTIRKNTFVNGKEIKIGDKIKDLLSKKIITKDEVAFLVVNGFVDETIEVVSKPKPKTVKKVENADPIK